MESAANNAVSQAKPSICNRERTPFRRMSEGSTRTLCSVCRYTMNVCMENIPTLFNKSMDEPRSIGARGGRAHGRNCRARRLAGGDAGRTGAGGAASKLQNSGTITILWFMQQRRGETRCKVQNGKNYRIWIPPPEDRCQRD